MDLRDKLVKLEGDVHGLETRLQAEKEAQRDEPASGLSCPDGGGVEEYLDFLKDEIERKLDVESRDVCDGKATHRWVRADGFNIIGNLRSKECLSGAWEGNVSVALAMVARMKETTYDTVASNAQEAVED